MSQRKPRSSTHPITTSIAIFVTALFLISPANAKTLQLTTYYPAPKAIYDRLNMLPQASTPSTCTIGSMMVDNATGNLLYCHDESGVGTWGSLDNIWKKTNNDIYPTDTATHPLIFMGIGTSTPSFKLTLNNDGGILAMGTFGSGTTITAVDSGRLWEDSPRLIWYPRKAAFRAVVATGDLYSLYGNDPLTGDIYGSTSHDMIGDYSVSFGYDTWTSGIATTSSGRYIYASGNYATVAGGDGNGTTGQYSVITGGNDNDVNHNYSVVSGVANSAYGQNNTIGGGYGNFLGRTTANSDYQTIGGGNTNMIKRNSAYATISGGELNHINPTVSAMGNYSTISGGQQNSTNTDYTSIGGGKSNIANGLYSYIGGGNANTASGTYSVIGGGDTNIASGNWSTIGGGRANTASGQYSTVLGGDTNRANATSSLIAGGSNNTITNTGSYSVIANGDHNTIAGQYSWVGGRYMNLSNTANRTFVWGYSDTTVNITAANAFILAPGTNSGSPVNPKLGIHDTSPTAILSIAKDGLVDYFNVTSTNLVTSGHAGDVFTVGNNGFVSIGKPDTIYPLEFGSQANFAYLTIGGVWTTPSSRKYKENIKILDSQKAIETIANLNPVTYNYKTNQNELHTGFIAEDVPDLIAEEGRKGLASMPITAVLTAVLKEQKQEIKIQDENLTNLENEVQNLKAELLQH